MPTIVRQNESLAKEISCKNCGGVNRYYPQEERELRRGKDYDGSSYIQYGFNCAQCGKELVTKEW